MAECVFSIKCLGRRAPGKPALRVPVDVRVRVSDGGGSSISLNVECVHNAGGHGQRCTASHLGQEKVGDGVLCPFSIDVPYYHDGDLVEGAILRPDLPGHVLERYEQQYYQE